MAKPFHECSGCMWPVGDLFCDAPLGRGKVYCDRHEAGSRGGRSYEGRYRGDFEKGEYRKSDREERVVAVDEFMRGGR